nr:hypothetical protein [Tanacetum cinerariifolium]
MMISHLPHMNLLWKLKLLNTLCQHLKEKESLEQKITLLKNDFQKEKSRNIDRELALEKQALGFQNPCYLKKAQQLKPKLYDGSVIEKSDAIVIPDTEETLMLAEEMQTDEPNLSATTTIVEVPKELPKVSMDFETHFVPQTELSAEQAFWSRYSVQPEEPNLSAGTTIVERTTVIAITEGTWGFEHTKACFRDDIIPFVKALKELFNSFDQFLIDELSEVQHVFKEMEQAVEQHYVCKSCVTIETEHQKDFIHKECYEMLFQKFNTLKKHCISLEIDNQLKKEIFERNTSFSQESALNFAELFEINDLKAQSQAKDTMIRKLREKLRSLSGDVKERKVKKEIEEIETLNIELDHRVTKLVAENEHLKQTYKQLYDSIKPYRVRSKELSLEESLSKLKGKDVVNEVVPLHSIDLVLLKIDVAPLASKLREVALVSTTLFLFKLATRLLLKSVMQGQ